jgi:hypothetical protein
MYRFADGKIVEMWWAWDTLGMMQQMMTPTSILPSTWGQVKALFQE